MTARLILSMKLRVRMSVLFVVVSSLVAVLVGGAAGCGGMYRVTPVRSGALYPSKGDGCAIDFQNVNFQEGSSKYENLGLISLSGAASDEFTAAMKKDVQRAACRMGGDAVSLNGSGPSFFQFIVWRAR